MNTTDKKEDKFLKRYLPGSSNAVLRLRRQVSQINSSRNISLSKTILIQGESGAGKGYLAQVIAGHRRYLAIMDTRDDPGVEAGLQSYCDHYGQVLLPALPDALIETELFGYKKGAFTDAKEDRPGLLGGERARKEYTDILLDEIGDATPPLQAKLLTVIETGQFMPVGGRPGDEYTTSARLILATNRNLRLLVDQGRFREDLYWRAKAIILVVPPLRAQTENIEYIARQIEAELQKLRGEDLSSTESISLTVEDIQWAKSYTWPGNVRQMKHALTRFLLESGNRRLKEIVQDDIEAEQEGKRPSPSIRSIIGQRLDGALSGELPAPGTLNDLVKEFESEIKESISNWCKAAGLDEDKYKTLFPDMDISSIRSKLSKWRTR